LFFGLLTGRKNRFYSCFSITLQGIVSMRLTLKRAAMVMAICVSSAAAMAGLPGVATLQVDAPQRAQPLSVTLWYPATQGSELVSIGGNAVFEGTPGLLDAPVAEGAFPVVLVSHGGMRSAPHLGEWIGAALAQRGFIALVVPAPRLGLQDAGIAPAELWKRPADITASLSALERHPDWRAHLDTERVGVLGFFLGGTTAMSLAGARLDAQGFSQLCDDGGTGLDCDWFRGQGVDLQAVDAGKLEGSRLEHRIGAVLVVDPEMSGVFSAPSLAAIRIPVLVLNQGGPHDILPGLDASGLAGAAPKLEYHNLAQASQFSAFSLCKPRGAFILAEEGGNTAICTSDAKPGRERIHAELRAMISGFFARTLKVGP
jgi:predicted dienelactone hydrolase